MSRNGTRVFRHSNSSSAAAANTHVIGRGMDEGRRGGEGAAADVGILPDARTAMVLMVGMMVMMVDFLHSLVIAFLLGRAGIDHPVRRKKEKSQIKSDLVRWRKPFGAVGIINRAEWRLSSSSSYVLEIDRNCRAPA